VFLFFFVSWKSEASLSSILESVPPCFRLVVFATRIQSFFPFTIRDFLLKFYDAHSPQHRFCLREGWVPVFPPSPDRNAGEIAPFFFFNLRLGRSPISLPLFIIVPIYLFLLLESLFFPGPVHFSPCHNSAAFVFYSFPLLSSTRPIPRPRCPLSCA